MPKQTVSMRMEPESISILLKLAKSEYGSETKKGYVVEDALKLLQAHLLRPLDATAALSVTEERLMSRMLNQLGHFEKNIVNRLSNLTAKTTYEACLTSLLVEDIHKKAGFDKNVYEQSRKEAASRMKKRYEKEKVHEIGGVIEENEHLHQVNQNVQERLQTAADTFEKMKQHIASLEAKNEELTQDNQQKDNQFEALQSWTNDFTNHLLDNYSRITPNSSLIQEFVAKNPPPKAD